jgi:putative membrane protein
MSQHYFNQDFKTRLWDVIAAVERNSQLEIVVIVRSRAADYADIPLYFGMAGAWLLHTYLMFVPTLFADITIYFGPLLGFVLCWPIGKIAAVQRFCVSQKRLDKSVEIMARALFQKGGLQHTQAKIGILIYCSVLEKSTWMIADRGAELAIPIEEWHSLRQRLQSIFTAAKPDEALLQMLADAQSVFNRYLPPVADDINELPDNLEITL